MVWAAAGRDEIALWDVAEGACRRVMRVLRPPAEAAEREIPSALSHLGGALAPAPNPAGRSDWASVGTLAAAAADGGSSSSSSSHPSAYETSPPPASASASASAPHEFDFRVGELQDAPPRLEGARCLLPLPSGSVLAGGSDACVRLWCPGDPARSRVVAGPLAPGGVMRDELTRFDP